ncbi:MAG: 3-deoxy-D-manno-octulosonic acid transferase, partial [Saprospiraceae bacterium]|nr:3-deoxy-D-manno-octulosonic acid transferase [Saprospiraceae bacterium]
MQLIVIWGYSFVVGLYGLVIALAALFNTKAKLWIQGRKNWPERLQQAVTSLHEAGKPIVWVHCASLGEFEQGRPLIEALRAQYPHLAIVLTIYSPSGYQVRQNYAHADVVCYMPLDTRRNALLFIKILQPRLVIFVKYEFWYHHLKALFQ